MRGIFLTFSSVNAGRAQASQMWGICTCVKKTNSFPNEYLWSVDFIDNNQQRIVMCSYLQFLQGCQRPSKHYRVIQDRSITRHNASTVTGPPDVAQTDKSRSNCAGGALLSSNVVQRKYWWPPRHCIECGGIGCYSPGGSIQISGYTVWQASLATYA